MPIFIVPFSSNILTKKIKSCIDYLGVQTETIITISQVFPTVAKMTTLIMAYQVEPTQAIITIVPIMLPTI